ncbi:MAG TPA: hypothetical protein VGV93_11860 [Acidimicrobiales bacterium]|nr:hypothetical protein [Acidimicrobiales bacterium]
MRIVAYAPDLMDRSKLSATAPAITFVSRPGQIAAQAGDADLAVVDLGRPGVLEVLADVAAVVPVIGYGSHVDRATLERAEAAGCQAMPRSRFFRNLGELLAP